MSAIDVISLGLIDYDKAMTLMAAFYDKRRQNQIPDTLLLLQHEAVITRGRRMHQDADMTIKNISDRGIAIRNADRGGLLTYHGPGQIVVYFIIKITQHFLGIADIVKVIEKGVQNFLIDLGLSSELNREHPGVWIGGKKIASIGLRIAQGVSSHGISLNVSNDLSVYNLFEPCGLPGSVMTNLETVWGRKIGSDEFEKLGRILCQKFQAVL